MIVKDSPPDHKPSSSSIDSGSSRFESPRISSLGSSPTREPSGRVLFGSRREETPSSSSSNSIGSEKVGLVVSSGGRSVTCATINSPPRNTRNSPPTNTVAKVPARTAAATTSATTTTISGAWQAVRKGADGKYTPPAELSSPAARNTFAALGQNTEEFTDSETSCTLTEGPALDRCAGVLNAKERPPDKNPTKAKASTSISSSSSVFGDITQGIAGREPRASRTSPVRARWSRSTFCTGIADSYRPPPASTITGREWLASGADIPAPSVGTFRTASSAHRPPPEGVWPGLEDSDDEDTPSIETKVVNQDYDKEEKEEVSWSWLDNIGQLSKTANSRSGDFGVFSGMGGYPFWP